MSSPGGPGPGKRYRGDKEAGAADRFNPLSLDALNGLLADARGAIGPYFSVFLVTQQHWSVGQVGVVTSVAGVLGLLVQTPIGALIDRTTFKRGLIVIGLAVLSLGAIIVATLPFFWPVLVANCLLAMVENIFAPTVAAITLGLVTRKQLAARLGRNAAFDHGGNASIALLAGVVGWYFSQGAVFFLVPILAGLAAFAVLSIPARAIDHERARSARLDDHGEVRVEGGFGGWRVLLTHRRLLTFACCVLLFHFANSPLLPLVGQRLAFAHPGYATGLTSACIITAQLVMLPISLLVGRRADVWGRKPLLIAAFVALPLRALLYTVTDDASLLIAIELLDGISSGLFGTLVPLVIADIMRGTGRFNVAQGAVGTLQGLGGAVSGLVTGTMVDAYGYPMAFLLSGAAALAALALLVVAMPETNDMEAV